MTSFSATQAAFAGFQFTRERPGAVAAWAGAILVSNLLSSVIGALVGGSALAEFERLLQDDALSGGDIARLLPRILPLVVITIVISLASNAIIYPSALRSFMRIDQRVSFRFGADERRTFLLLLSLLAINFAVSMGVTVSLSLVGAVLGSISSVLGVFINGLTPLVTFVACIVVLVRLSLTLVIVVDRKRIDLKESWLSTRGHFFSIVWSLIISLFFFLLVSVVTVILIGVLKGLITLGAHGLIDLNASGVDRSSLSSVLAPGVIFFQAGFAAIIGMMLPVIMGPLVRAYAAYDEFPAIEEKPAAKAP